MFKDALSELFRSEEASKSYLVKSCRIHGCGCPRCTTIKRCYKLADGRQRCPRCEYTFHDFTGRWINNGGLTCRQWLLLTNLFVQNFSLKAMCHWVGIAYNTAYKAVTTIRQSIAAQSNDILPLLCNSAAWSEGPLVFERHDNGRLHFTFQPEIKPCDVMNLPVRKHLWRNLIFCDPYDEAGGYIFCFDGSFRNHCNLGRGDIGPLTDAGHLMWQTIREHMNRFQGVTPKRFPLYLKEFEFRQSNAPDDWFPLVIQSLCAWEPRNGKLNKFIPCNSPRIDATDSGFGFDRPCRTDIADTTSDMASLCQNLR